MQRWLVMSNCQTIGLANCLQAQTAQVSVAGLDPAGFNARRWQANARMKRFNKLLIAPSIKSEVPKARLDQIGSHVSLPTIAFRGYHPDLIYLSNRDKPLSGPVSHYHSAITFACFEKGISPTDAQSYFTGQFFEQCGYFAIWADERERLLADFRSHGLDIAPYFTSWGRTKAFMYSYNHPRIEPLYDMASVLLEGQGVTQSRSDLMPRDNLANSAIFAVYPEIGEATGVRGQYQFRAVGDYRPIGLTEYIGRSYDVYQRAPAGELRPFPEFKEQVDRIKQLL
tara:strand:- start:5546 stop:6394 length:849 start_codon:yes stop_codon:yes gene_type:complete